MSKFPQNVHKMCKIIPQNLEFSSKNNDKLLNEAETKEKTTFCCFCVGDLLF